METNTPAPPPSFKDRKTWLIFFGILLILFGAFCGLMVPLMILGMIVSSALEEPEASMSISMMIPGALFYLVLAVWWIWLGIGAFQARRWARALILVSSWLWLIIGIISLISTIVFLPGVYEQMEQTQELPPGMTTMMISMTIGFMALFYVIIPGLLVAFFHSRHVRATCEAAHPQPSWTDRCPLPVLGLSLLFAFGALWTPSLGFYNWAIPFFGNILTGAAGAVIAILMTAVTVYVAWGTYRLDIRAWWASLALILFWFSSAAITFSQVGLMEFYRKMDCFPEDQLEMMEALNISETGMLLLMGLSLVLLGGYILFTKRYFSPAGPSDPSASENSN
jgi:uncharacterized membrane protein